MNIAVLILYILSTFLVGWVVMQMWFGGLPFLFTITGAFLLGTAFCVPVTYGLTGLFGRTGAPMFWGVLGTTLSFFVIAGYVLLKKSIQHNLKRQTISVYEYLLLLFSLAFSAWVMFKTFHGEPGGVLFVGSNNVFDFGHALGIIRSFSWGSNIPLMSPFESGLPFFYHFFFYFWVAIWEYFGVPTVWAMNIPSIISFTSMLIVIYYLPQTLIRQKSIIGWIAVVLTITNGSLTFWQLLAKSLSFNFIKDLWRTPNYPFAGPFDGSVISLFVTINNYVNQRHLAFSIALGLFLYVLTWKILNDKKDKLYSTVAIGAVSGVLFLWNIAIFPIVVFLCGILYVFRKEWRLLSIYLVTALGIALLVNAPNLQILVKAFFNFGGLFIAGGTPVIRQPTWNIVQYLWQNLGLLPIIAFLGFVTLSKKHRVVIFPFAVLFVVECIFAGFGRRGFDQKFYSILIIGINVLAGVCLLWIWEKQLWAAKLAAILLFGMLTISGIVDLMPIKNEFAFPLVNQQILPVISWIHTHTAKDVVFVSYADIIDPVVLAGRKNYFGYFGDLGYLDRSVQVRQIYAGDTMLARSSGISYVLVPKWQKNDFPYTINETELKNIYHPVYEDNNFIIFSIK